MEGRHKACPWVAHNPQVTGPLRRIARVADPVALVFLVPLAYPASEVLGFEDRTALAWVVGLLYHLGMEKRLSWEEVVGLVAAPLLQSVLNLKGSCTSGTWCILWLWTYCNGDRKLRHSYCSTAEQARSASRIGGRIFAGVLPFAALKYTPLRVSPRQFVDSAIDTIIHRGRR